jgi:hypothetical protein
MGVPRQQGFRGHDHPVEAIAALRSFFRDESALDRIRLIARA